jgi:hypothetical protein
MRGLACITWSATVSYWAITALDWWTGTCRHCPNQGSQTCFVLRHSAEQATHTVTLFHLQVYSAVFLNLLRVAVYRTRKTNCSQIMYSITINSCMYVLLENSRWNSTRTIYFRIFIPYFPLSSSYLSLPTLVSPVFLSDPFKLKKNVSRATYCVVSVYF